MVATALGFTQILAFGTSLYLLGVLADFMLADTGWSRAELALGFTIAVLVAGVLAPRIGHAIQSGRGFRVLLASPFLFAAGLGLMSVASNYATYLAAWVLLGGGMATGLYDSVFGVLGRTYGLEARFLITTVTLLGAFASTCSWPAAAFLVGEFGWRGALQGFALAHLAICLPLFWFFAPRSPQAEPLLPADRPQPSVELHGKERLSFFVLTAILALKTTVAVVVAVHLVAILQARGASLNAAVAAAAMIGPAQVSSRLADVVLGRFTGALSALFLSMGAIAAGILALEWNAGPLWLALAIYGAGIGLGTIARGAAPLLLFPVEKYAAIVGRMSRPIAFTQALAPYLAASLAASSGIARILPVLGVLAVLNVGLVGVLAWIVSRSPSERRSPDVG